LKESYDNIVVEIPPAAENEKKNVALITLYRPKALNALSGALFEDLLHATKVLDADSDIRCMVLTGSKKAFAAGADISEMKDKQFEECYGSDMFAEWQEVSKLKTPIIAAVSGFCLGGGCELAMMCDMMVCSQSAKVRTEDGGRLSSISLGFVVLRIPFLRELSEILCRVDIIAYSLVWTTRN
jgi:enoyl-CoA hydratase/carnithine racemase